MTTKKKLPNSRDCFGCGLGNINGLKLEFYQDEQGEVFCSTVVPDHFQGYPGYVHGGIVASMLDEMICRVFYFEDPNRHVFTAKLTVRYRKPVPTDQLLKMVSRMTKDRKRTGTSIAELFGPEGELLAEAEGLVVSLPSELSLDAEALGWKVYPNETEEK
jgi:acyl-coenzyme A thioesterase PaaI-like protein